MTKMNAGMYEDLTQEKHETSLALSLLSAEVLPFPSPLNPAQCQVPHMQKCSFHSQNFRKRSTVRL